MRKIFILSLFLLSGCGHYFATVYGKSGVAYTAPSLCGALVKCMNSSESACFYDKTVLSSTVNSTIEESGCKEVKK